MPEAKPLFRGEHARTLDERYRLNLPGGVGRSARGRLGRAAFWPRSGPAA